MIYMYRDPGEVEKSNGGNIDAHHNTLDQSSIANVKTWYLEEEQLSIQTKGSNWSPNQEQPKKKEVPLALFFFNIMKPI